MATIKFINVFYILLIHNFLSTAYEDKDLKCSLQEHLSGFIRKINGKGKEISHRCSNFSPKISEDSNCYLGIALKCNGNYEGCDDPSAWIGGFQMFDMGDKLETYVPYCCTSPSVTIRNTKCKPINLSGSTNANINFNIPADRLLYRFSCEYTKALIGQKLSGMKIGAEDCAYTVDKRK